jgi:hypothetical protein
VPRLSAGYLETPGVAADPGTVQTTKVKIGSKRLTVFTFQTTPPPAPALPAGTVFQAASVEVRPHLVLTTTVPQGADPLPPLTAMLKAGAGKIPRVPGA